MPKKSADAFATTKPVATIDPATKVGYSADFEDVEIGTKTEDAITGDGIKGVVLRGHKKADDGGVGTSKECMDTRLEFYVKTVMNHVLSSEYADCLYSYDVVNEYLHSLNAEKDSKNITYWGLIYGTYDKSVKDHGVTLRPSYVKDAFKYAHEMLVKYNRTDVKLIYNDYNCYQNPENIIHLVDYINSDGKICDGIGMQSHLDITDSFHSATNYAKALEYFRLNCPDLETQITELDATMSSTDDKPLTDEDQAAYYDQIMNAILTNKKNGGTSQR